MASKNNYAARATQYARKVVNGKIQAPKLVQAACRRHLGDLESSKSAEYDYRFDADKANQIGRFAEKMVHIKGPWAGDKIVLEDWQCFVLCVPFGWVRKSDGLRRFREIYAEIPRKNSKSTLGAVIGLYMLVADGEKGAEVYPGATSEKQAMEVHRPAWLMVSKNPGFMGYFGLELGGTEKNPGPIYCMGTSSRMEAIIGKPGDGASPSCAIVDEYHEHKTSQLYDAMDTGMGARQQPMKVVITTAGTDISVPCYDKHLKAIKVLDRSRENDRLFTVIYAADPDDDWQDFEVWRKTNPNAGVSVFEDFLQEKLEDALQNPGQQNVMLCKHLDLWRNAGENWMNIAKWEECKNPSLSMDSFSGMPCWVGMDLASKIDIASMVAVFRCEDGFAAFGKHYIPRDMVERPSNDHYRRWEAENWLTATDGVRTDFHRIEDDLKDWSHRFAVQELCYDPREASYLIEEIETWASFDCIEVTQGPALMSEPMKEVEALVYSGQFRHQGDPVFTWMISNVVKKTARGGGPVKYCYPTKQSEGSKIDAAVALIMAILRAKKRTPEDDYYSGEEVVM